MKNLTNIPLHKLDPAKLAQILDKSDVAKLAQILHILGLNPKYFFHAGGATLLYRVEGCWPTKHEWQTLRGIAIYVSPQDQPAPLYLAKFGSN